MKTKTRKSEKQEEREREREVDLVGKGQLMDPETKYFWREYDGHRGRYVQRTSSEVPPQPKNL